MAVRIYRPDFRVHIYPENSGGKIGVNSTRVLSISTSQDIMSPSGSWNVKTHDPRLFDACGPMDRVFIYLSRDKKIDASGKSDPALVMRGMLDRPSETFSVSDSSGALLLDLAGRSMAKILLEHNLIFTNPYEMAGSSMAAQITAGIEIRAGDSAAQAARKTVEYASRQYKRLTEDVDFDSLYAATEGMKFRGPHNVTEGSVWSALAQVLESPFHLYWVDHAGVFQFRHFLDLMKSAPDENLTITDDDLIPPSDIASWERSKSDYEVLTWASVIPMEDLQKDHTTTDRWGYAPHVDELSADANIKRYGFRMRRFYDVYSSGDEDLNAKAAAALKYFANFYSMTVTVRGESKYSQGLGKRLRVKATLPNGRKINDIFLLESCSQDFVWGDHWFSTLGLSKGEAGS